MHAGQPPARDDLRLRDVLQVDDAENVIGEAVEVRRHVRVAAAGPPEPVHADAGHLEERNLARLRGTFRDIEDRKTGAERLALAEAVGERVLEVVARVVVTLAAREVRAVREQQVVAGRLQVVRARERRREEVHGLERARVARVEHRDAVAEHVADVEVSAARHHLHAVGAAALVAIRDVPDAAADAFGRNPRRCRSARRRGRCVARLRADGARQQRGRRGAREPREIGATCLHARTPHGARVVRADVCGARA